MPELDLVADLRLELTTSTGDSTTAEVHGDGSRLMVEVERPQVFLDALGREQTGQLAGLLAAQGIVAHVHDSRGRVATVGAGVHSRYGRLLAGSDRVRPARGAALRLVTWSRLVETLGVALPDQVRRRLPARFSR